MQYFHPLPPCPRPLLALRPPSKRQREHICGIDQSLLQYRTYLMSFANDPAFIAFKNSHKHVPIQGLNGTVFIISYSEPLPPVGRRLTKTEGLQHKEQLKTILDEWSIVSFDQGGITGSGYHYEIKETVGSECGEGFVLIPGIHQ